MKHKVKCIRSISDDMHLVFVEKKGPRMVVDPDYDSIDYHASLT